MLDDVLVFLKNHLNHQLTPQDGMAVPDTQEEMVVFLDGEKVDPISFKLGAVTALMINVEEENTLRPPEPFQAVSADGSKLSVKPDIRLNIFVLFVARFKQYELGLSYLSDIIKNFQANRVFDHHNAPELSEDIDKLILELVTLPFAEQNELWNALRSTYLPSVLYKVKMIVYRDADSRRMPEVAEKTIRTSQ